MYTLAKKDREAIEQTRGKYAAEARWYAAMTHHGEERRVRDQVLLDFSHTGVEEILLPELQRKNPSRKKGRSPDLLFPCYVFLRCRMNDEIYMRVSAYETVHQILGRAYRIPSVLDEEEIVCLKKMLAMSPQPRLATRLNAGDWARVTEGLMEGLKGRVVECNARYVKLETGFSFLDRGASVIVAIPRTQVSVQSAGK